MPENIAKKPTVCVNLCRLVVASKGAGGAGWFAIELAAVLAHDYDVIAVTSPSTASYVRDELSRRDFGLGRVEVAPTGPEDFLKNCPVLPDVWIDPLNGLEPLDIPQGIARIATLHDFMFLREPQVFVYDEIKSRTKEYFTAVANAHVVITIAEREKLDILKYFPEKAVHVVHQYPYFQLETDHRETTSSETKSICLFSPGVQWNHKNHFRLVSAFLYLLESGQIPSNTLLCLSSIRPVEAGHNLTQQLLAQSPWAENVIFLPYLTKAQLAEFHLKCNGYVLPSLHEGYGIPLIESVANGIPTLSARFPSIDALSDVPDFIQFIEDPSDTGDLIEALGRFINDLPSAHPRPDLCPTRQSFKEQLCSAIDHSLTIARQKPNLSLPSIKAPQPRAEKLSAFVLQPEQMPLPKKSPSNIDELVFFGHRGIQGSQKSRSATMNLNKESLGIVFTHEWVLSRNRFILICSGATLEEIDAQRLTMALARLERAECGHVCLADLVFPGTVTTVRYETLPLGLWDLNYFNTPFDIRPNVLISTLASAPSLTDPSLPRAIITDPGLKNEYGHHIIVARDLAIGLSEAGYNVIGAINHSANVSHIEGVNPLFRVFSDFFYEQIGDVGLYVHEFQHAMRLSTAMSGDLVFAHCASPAMLAGLAIWLAQQPPKDRPNIVIRFDRPASRAPDCLVSYKQCFELINTLGLREFFSFTVESKGLQRYFTQCSGEEFPIRFNSVFIDKNRSIEILGLAKGERALTTVSYVGEAREEKGFQHLPFILEHIWNKKPVRFRIQVGANNWNQTPSIELARQRLEQLAIKHPDLLELLDGKISDDDYISLIRDTDIILMPYDPRAYNIRGSGVASEASAIGKVIVVSHGCDITRTYDRFAVIESEAYSPLDLAIALDSAIDCHSDLVVQASPAETEVIFPRSRRAFAEQFVVNAAPDISATSKVVLWIANDTVGEGSDSVYQSQIEFLRSRGYLPICIRVPYPARWRLKTVAQFDWSEFIVTPSITPSFEDCPEFEEVLQRFEAGTNSMRNFMDAWSFLKLPPELVAFLRNVDVAFAVVNYAHHRPVVSRLLGREVPMIVESHDIQAYQYAIQQRRPVRETEVEEELELLSSFDHIVSISASEASKISSVCGQEKVSWCMPYFDNTPIQLTDKWDYDVLFVGSNHDANVVSLQWFIQAVYEPLLYSQGVTLRVVGSVGSMVDIHRFGGLVDVTGRVADLSPHYAKCGVVALPIIAGAGVPIKVLDAMGRGVPFVVTDFPSAAMSFNGEIPVARNPNEMAQQILSCLADQDERKGRSEIGLDFAAKHSSRTCYFSQWDKILAQLTGSDGG